VVRKPLVECSFLIPIRRDPDLSDGKPHRRPAWKWLDDRLYDFGGATRAGDLYQGWYRDADTGEAVQDLSKKYFVALPRKDVSRLRSLLSEACLVFQQKCIYLSVAGRVEFIQESEP
jgi:hypothetical protein